MDVAFGRYYDEKSSNVARPKELMVILGRLADRLGSQRVLSDITMNDLLRYQTQRRTEVANRTVNTDLMDTLRPIYKQARKWGVEVGPLGQTDFEWSDLKLRTPRGRVRWLSRNEKARLYKAVSKDYRPLIKFALLTALRRGPLLIARSQIDWDMGLITYAKKSKYENDLGFLPIIDLVERLLRAEIAKAPDCKSVFTYRARRTFGGRVRGERYPITVEGFKSEMQRAVKRAELGDWRLIHDLRHTAATDTLRASKDIASVRDMLGHSDVAQTEKYAHVVSEDVRKAMSARRR